MKPQTRYTVQVVLPVLLLLSSVMNEMAILAGSDLAAGGFTVVAKRDGSPANITQNHWHA